MPKKREMTEFDRFAAYQGNRTPGVFTVGHSNHPIERFLGLLAEHAIEALTDVRSVPRSGYSPTFDQAPLRLALAEAGIRYVFLGDSLGGRPHDRDFYDPDGYVRYDRLAASEVFADGLDRLLAGAAQYRVAIMCGEEEPTACHRRLLVARVLTGRGVAVWHIRGDGRVQDESSFPPPSGTCQPGLFDEGDHSGWRSARSVLRSIPPPRSSGG